MGAPNFLIDPLPVRKPQAGSQQTVAPASSDLLQPAAGHEGSSSLTTSASPVVARVEAPDAILWLQRAAGNQAAQKVAATTVRTYTITIDGSTRTLTEAQYAVEVAKVTKLLTLRFDLIEEEASWNAAEHARFMKEDHNTTNSFSDWMGDVSPPPVSIWKHPRSALDSGRAALREGRLEVAARQLKNSDEALRDVKRDWTAYMQGTSEGAGKAIVALETTRDVSFAIAIGTAAVVALPVVAAGAGVAAAGAGLTGAAATAATVVGTGATITAGGALVGGTVRAGTSAAGQKLAGDEVNLGTVGKEFKAGFKRGAVDALSGVVGGGAGKALGVGAKGLSAASNALRGGTAGMAAGATGGGAGAIADGKSGTEVLMDTTIGAVTGLIGGGASAGAASKLGGKLAAVQPLVEGGVGGVTGGASSSLAGGDFWTGFGTGAIAGLASGAASPGATGKKGGPPVVHDGTVPVTPPTPDPVIQATPDPLVPQSMQVQDPVMPNALEPLAPQSMQVSPDPVMLPAHDPVPISSAPPRPAKTPSPEPQPQRGSNSARKPLPWKSPPPRGRMIIDPPSNLPAPVIEAVNQASASRPPQEMQAEIALPQMPAKTPSANTPQMKVAGAATDRQPKEGAHGVVPAPRANSPRVSTKEIVGVEEGVPLEITYPKPFIEKTPSDVLAASTAISASEPKLLPPTETGPADFDRTGALPSHLVMPLKSDAKPGLRSTSKTKSTSPGAPPTPADVPPAHVIDFLATQKKAAPEPPRLQLEVPQMAQKHVAPVADESGVSLAKAPVNPFDTPAPTTSKPIDPSEVTLDAVTDSVDLDFAPDKSTWNADSESHGAVDDTRVGAEPEQPGTFGQSTGELTGTEHRSGLGFKDADADGSSAGFHDYTEAEVAVGLRVERDQGSGMVKKVSYDFTKPAADYAGSQESSRSFTVEWSDPAAQSRRKAYEDYNKANPTAKMEMGHLGQREAAKVDPASDAALGLDPVKAAESRTIVERGMDKMNGVVPMLQSVNRGKGSVWAASERRTADLASQLGSVRVEVEPVYAANPPRLSDGTPIPARFKRSVLHPLTGAVLDFIDVPNQ